VSNALVRYVITDTGERIGFDMCFAPDCRLHLSRCACEDGPTPPHLGTTTTVTFEPRAPIAAA